MDIIVIQIILVIINSYLAITENKNNIYVVTFLFNLANLIMYAIKGDKTTVIIYVVITLRSLIYIFKDKLIKYNFIPITFILIQLGLGVITMDNPWQMISISAPCFTCYYLWYLDTTQKLRVGNIIANSLWAVYNIVNGLYIASLSRLITIAVNSISYYKNRDKSKKQ